MYSLKESISGKLLLEVETWIIYFKEELSQWLLLKLSENSELERLNYLILCVLLPNYLKKMEEDMAKSFILTLKILSDLKELKKLMIPAASDCAKRSRNASDFRYSTSLLLV